MEEVTLPGLELSVGHCVILNDFEKPCGKLVTVVVEIIGKFAYLKYLNAEKELSSYNTGKGIGVRIIDNKLHNITPLEKFGVVACYNPETKLYYCKKVSESVATYKNGEPRQWQESEPYRYKARPTVVKFCLSPTKQMYLVKRKQLILQNGNRVEFVSSCIAGSLKAAETLKRTLRENEVFMGGKRCDSDTIEFNTIEFDTTDADCSCSVVVTVTIEEIK